jgi:hypothetical protein
MLAVLLAAAEVRAGFIGNPAPEVAGVHSFRHGLDMDRTSRKLVTSRWNSPVTLTSTRFAARESYGLTGWKDILIEVSGIFGISKANIDFGTVDLAAAPSNLATAAFFWETYAPDVPHFNGRRTLTFGDGYGPLLGAALRSRLFEWRGISLSLGGQVMYSRNADTGQPAMDFFYNEWDLFAGASWERRFFSFYAGVDQSWLVGEITTQSDAIGTDLDQETALGAFAGTSFHFYRHWDIVGEMRLINQSSFSLQVLYEF